MTAIQPCALLLLVGPDWQIETISANAAMLGDVRPGELVGQPLADLIGSKAIHSLRNRMAWLSSEESEVQDFGVEWGDVTFDIRAIRNDESYLIEAELAVEPRLPDGIGMVRSMSDRLSGNDPIKLAAQAMQQLSSVTGFEQLLLCDRSGQSIAANGRQASVPGLEPATIARFVADRDAEPVPIVGNLDGDLLRRAAYLSPSAEEGERLHRANIGSFMSLPLKIDGELVGAIQALHSSPRRIGAERRSVGHLFAERLVARMARMGWQP